MRCALGRAGLKASQGFLGLRKMTAARMHVLDVKCPWT